MNSVVILVATVACLVQSNLASYAGIYLGGYGGQGALIGGGAYYGSGAGAGGASQGSVARPVVLPSGFLADTPEVAAARVAHLAALSKTSAVVAASGAGGSGAGAYGAGMYGAAGLYGAGALGAGASGAGSSGAGQRYAGPLAIPVVLPSGYLADTHEVVAARGAHLVALANSASRSASYGGVYGGYGGYGGYGVYGGYGAGYYG